ncbi:MAG: hypothetical protein JO329_04660 [Planctomycetaceae bacterium]|nr:hypothetical protein [Planctomycetaceae bacterium]
MDEIPEAWWAVFNTLIAGPVACRTPAEVAAALGRDVEEVTDLLSALDVSGWLEVWDCESGPLVTLSSLAAERLQVHLVEVGVDESPRWAPVGDPLPSPPKAKYVSAAADAAALNYVIDLAPGPDIVAERAEAAARSPSTSRGRGDKHAKAEELPRPTFLVGQGLTPWPGPNQRRSAVCPACGHLRFRPHMYCLYCDRWGMDGLVATIPAKVGCPRRGPRSQLSPEQRVELERLQYERERGHREARRLTRHQAQVEEERHHKKSQPAKGRATPNPPKVGPSREGGRP